MPLYKEININEEFSNGRDEKQALDIEMKELHLYIQCEEETDGCRPARKKCQKYGRHSKDDPFMSYSINRSHQAATPRSPNIDSAIFSSEKED